VEINNEIIIKNTGNPDILEDLYQSNKREFSETIKIMHNENSDIIIKYWYARLFYRRVNPKRNTGKYIFTAFLIIIAWIPLRLIFTDTLKDNINIIRAVPIIASIALSLFFMFETIKVKEIIKCFIPGLILYFYFFILPDKAISQSLDNAFYFMLVLLWFFVLLSQSNYDFKKPDYGIFLEKCGEIIVWSTMFIIGGMVIVGLSIALFNAIIIDTQAFYMKNIATLGVAASPFISLLVIENYNKIKLSIIIANIFLPIVLVSLFVFGVISIFNNTKPYEDREIFVIYNIMNIIVICILVFTGINNINNKFIYWCSCILPVITIILNIVTLSAVIYRINEYGITPNKITLLGTNIVMLGHIISIVFRKYKKGTENNFKYLPVYFVWSFIVVFIFPVIFKFA